MWVTGLVLPVLLVLTGWLGIRYCDRANCVDWGSRWLNRIDGLNRILCYRFHRLRADVPSLPARGGAIVVANHISGLDPLLMIAACDRPLRFLIAREQYDRFGLRWLFRGAGCIPVERDGRPELAYRSAMKALRRGEVVAVFPQGGIHLPGSAPARLKSGAVRLALACDVPIVPMYLTGVRGAGHTLLAVLLRSRARLRMYPAFRCDQGGVEASMVRIRAAMDGKLTGQA